MSPSANAYIAKMRRIPGWLTVKDALALCVISEIQDFSDISGDILEFGVYHGQSLGLLDTFRRGEERLIGADQFTEAAPLQVQRNLNDVGIHLKKCVLVVGNTQEFNSNGELDPLKVRLVHIDAGHEEADVYKDLLTVHPYLTEDGVIAVDDYFDKDSPGVAFATVRACKHLGLVPFLCGQNKIFLCRPEAVEFYLRAVLETEPFKSSCRIQTLQTNPILVGYPDKPHEQAAMVQQVKDFFKQPRFGV